jgi:MIP family channel proteins
LENLLPSLPQKLAAEFFGTLFFVFAGIAAICADQYLRTANQSTFGPLGISLAFGLAFAVAIAALGHISGGHFNPAITIAFWVTRRLGTIQFLLYVAAQIVGAIAAAYLVRAILPDTAWMPVGLGTPALTADFTRTQGMSLEAVLTFFLVFIFFATVVDTRASLAKAGSFAVGLTLTIGVLVGQPFTGAALNPARALGPALASAHWSNHGVFWLGPLAGGFIAGLVYDRLFLREKPPA